MAEKKLPALQVLREMAGDGAELPDALLDEVAGGAYTVEEWNRMSNEERQAAQQRSLVAKLILNVPCELD